MNLRKIGHVMYEGYRKSAYRLDEYPLMDGRKHPFAVICPGGGYRMIADHVEGEPIARELNKLGYAAFVLWYGCNRRAAFPKPIEDLARAVGDILSRADELGVDPGNYSVWGASAGGHLAASFCTERVGYLAFGLPRPKAAVLLYPVVSMGEYAHKGSKKRFIGRHPSKEAVMLTSVEKQISESFPPTYVWYGKEDTCVNPENGNLLKAALEEKKIPCLLDVYPAVGHGVGLGKGRTCEGWFARAVGFWEQAAGESGALHNGTAPE